MAISREQAQEQIARAKSRCHIALARASHARCDRDLDEIIDEVRREHFRRQAWEQILAALPS